MPVQPSLSKEDTKEVAKKENAVKWMVEAISSVDAINQWSLVDRPADLKTYPFFLTLYINKNAIILTCY